MKYEDKQKLYKEFLNEWGEQFSKITQILKELALYPEIISDLFKDELLSIEDIDESQLEWVSLFSQFDYSEKMFFKPFWVPITKNSYDFFIDISDNKFPIFDTVFIPIVHHQWYKIFVFKNINELLHSIGNPTFNVNEILERVKSDKIKLIG